MHSYNSNGWFALYLGMCKPVSILDQAALERFSNLKLLSYDKGEWK